MSIIKYNTGGVRRAKAEHADETYCCAVLINVHIMYLPPAVRHLKQLKLDELMCEVWRGKGDLALTSWTPPGLLMRPALEKTTPTPLI